MTLANAQSGMEKRENGVLYSLGVPEESKTATRSKTRRHTHTMVENAKSAAAPTAAITTPTRAAATKFMAKATK